VRVACDELALQEKTFGISDAKLGESVLWNGFTPGWTGNPGERVTRFAAALWVNNVLIERYGAFAGYLQVGRSLSAIESVPRLSLAK
jgi:hypothetical protein